MSGVIRLVRIASATAEQHLREAEIIESVSDHTEAAIMSDVTTLPMRIT